MKNESSRILSCGDYFERANGPWILERIPAYAKIWSEFIGNDGHSDYLPMVGVSRKVMVLREAVWEHLYSLFESLALCRQIELKFTAVSVIDSLQSYGSHLNDWMAFFAHLGRIRDMAEKVALIFRRADYDKRGNTGEVVDEDRTLYLPFDEFYNSRHTVVHYIKTPMTIVDGLLKAPRVGTKPGNWWQKMQWNDLEVEQFVYVADLLSETLKRLENVAEVFFGRVYGLLKDHGCRAVTWNPPSAFIETIGLRMNDPPSSSEAVAPPSSSGAVAPPSGMKGGPWRM